jgi:hypothetical protein
MPAARIIMLLPIYRDVFVHLDAQHLTQAYADNLNFETAAVADDCDQRRVGLAMIGGKDAKRFVVTKSNACCFIPRNIGQLLLGNVGSKTALRVNINDFSLYAFGQSQTPE